VGKFDEPHTTCIGECGQGRICCLGMATTNAAHPTKINSRRRLGYYAIVALFLAAWVVNVIYNAIVYIPQMWTFAYFSVDYRLGFVRRGLAGQILGLFPTDLYFGGLWTLRCLLSVLFVIGLVAVAWTVAVKFGRSERRLMLALLIPVLPFGFVTALWSPQTELLAGVALAAFAVVLVSVSESRSILFASTAYGVTTAMLTLIHEASPLLYSLGAVVAIVVLSRDSPSKIQRISILLAISPGLVVELAVGLLGRRGISSQLCALVPHRAVNWPAAGHLSSAQVLKGERFYVDYHDWVCRNIIDKLDQSPADAARYVASFGAVALISSMVVGIFIFTVSILAIRYISGVPFGRFCRVLRGKLVWVTFAAMLFLPLFATSSDWTRWWVRASFDVGIVYLLYASSQPEAGRLCTWRARILFVIGITLFAIFPMGGIVSVGMPTPV